MNYGLGGSILVHKDVDDPNQIDETFSVRNIITTVNHTHVNIWTRTTVYMEALE